MIHSIEVLEPRDDLCRIEIRSEGLKRGWRMAYSRSKIADAENPSGVPVINEGQGPASSQIGTHHHRRTHTPAQYRPAAANPGIHYSFISRQFTLASS